MRLTMQPVCDRTGLTSDSATELSGCDKAASCKVSFAVQQKTPPQSNFALIRTCDLDPATTVNWPLNTQTQTIVFHPGGAIMFLRGFFAAISNKITSTLEGIFYRYHPKDGMGIFDIYWRWGLLVVSHPWLVILSSLLLCGGLSGGLLLWDQETDQELLWTPYGSPVELSLQKNSFHI